MITLSTVHAAERAAAALSATLAKLNSGASGATIALYATTRPSIGAAPGASALATFTLDQPAGSIASGVLTLAPADNALILTTGVALWARVEANGAIVFDCDVSDTAGTATIRLAASQLYAGGSVNIASGVLS